MNDPGRNPSTLRKFCFRGFQIGLIWIGGSSYLSAQQVLPPRSYLPMTPLPSQSQSNVFRSTQTAPHPDSSSNPMGSLVQPNPSSSPTDKVGRTFTIGQAIQIALDQSPIIKSVHGGMESAEASIHALDRASRLVINPFSPDLKFRKQQASNGLIAAQAEYRQAQHDVTYNVVRTYYSAVYAKQQLRVANEILVQLNGYLSFVKQAVIEGSDRKITKTTEDTLVQYVARAKAKKLEAEFGYKRALAGLRHELNLGNEENILVSDDTLPTIPSTLNHETIVAHALSRRGEIVLAQSGADVLKLEVCAQGAVRFRLRLPTVAAAADFHSRTVPQGSRDGEYRPDALSPDLPVFLVGDRESRVTKAKALSQKADFLLEKTRELVRLEATNSFLRWEEYRDKMAEWKIAAEAARASVQRTRKDTNNLFTDEKILTVEGLAAESIASWNEATYQYLIALAAIERATAGGVKINYPGR